MPPLQLKEQENSSAGLDWKEQLDLECSSICMPPLLSSIITT
jgi:hypothetical protein